MKLSTCVICGTNKPGPRVYSGLFDGVAHEFCSDNGTRVAWWQRVDLEDVKANGLPKAAAVMRFLMTARARKRALARNGIETMNPEWIENAERIDAAAAWLRNLKKLRLDLKQAKTNAGSGRERFVA